MQKTFDRVRGRRVNETTRGCRGRLARATAECPCSALDDRTFACHFREAICCPPLAIANTDTGDARRECSRLVGPWIAARPAPRRRSRPRGRRDRDRGPHAARAARDRARNRMGPRPHADAVRRGRRDHSLQLGRAAAGRPRDGVRRGARADPGGPAQSQARARGRAGSRRRRRATAGATGVRGRPRARARGQRSGRAARARDGARSALGVRLPRRVRGWHARRHGAHHDRLRIPGGERRAALGWRAAPGPRLDRRAVARLRDLARLPDRLAGRVVRRRDLDSSFAGVEGLLPRSSRPRSRISRS